MNNEMEVEMAIGEGGIERRDTKKECWENYHEKEEFQTLCIPSMQHHALITFIIMKT